MRKDAKKALTISNDAMHGYHAMDSRPRSEYALDGFGENGKCYYWSSDRYSDLDSVSNPKGYGFEIETENAFDFDSVQKGILYRSYLLSDFKREFFKLQSDGSLNNGCECITGIATKETIRNYYPRFKAMFEKFRQWQVTAGTSRCGMHCNISIGLFGKTETQQAQNLAKLHYLINKNYDFFCIMLKRRRNCTDYCSRMRLLTVNEYKAMTSLSDLVNQIGGSHGVCLNYSHLCEGKAARAEIRLVGGQSDYYAFRNTCEVIFQLIHALNNDITWSNIDDLSILFKGANYYVGKRLMEAQDILGSQYNDCYANCDMTNKPYEF